MECSDGDFSLFFSSSMIISRILWQNMLNSAFDIFLRLGFPLLIISCFIKSPPFFSILTFNVFKM